MLEIIILFLLGKKVAAMCNSRGRTAWPWVVLLVLSWYGGAIAGAVLAVIITFATDPNAQEPDLLLLLGFVLGGAVCGVSFVMLVVSMLQPVERYEDEDDDEYDRPRRRRYEDEEEDEEDYDRPRKRRREDDEYDRDKTW